MWDSLEITDDSSKSKDYLIAAAPSHYNHWFNYYFLDALKEFEKLYGNENLPDLDPKKNPGILKQRFDYKKSPYAVFNVCFQFSFCNNFTFKI